MVNLVEDGPGDVVDIPGQFVNGFHDWYVVMDPNGQEVIELVDDNDNEPDALPGPFHAPPGIHIPVMDPHPVPVPEPHDNDNPNPHVVPVENYGVLNAVELVDVGVQVTPFDFENTSDTTNREGDGVEDVEEMDSDESDSVSGDPEEMETDTELSSDPGYCWECGRTLSLTLRQGRHIRELRSRRFFMVRRCNVLLYILLRFFFYGRSYKFSIDLGCIKHD